LLTNRSRAGHELSGDPGSRGNYSEALSGIVREHVDQILADQLFRNSQRYSNLLRFIVDRTLKGHTEELKERVIGVEVFGRSPTYDTSADPTVRVAANEIRKRLINYYAKASPGQNVRIDVPLGSYVAEFSFTEPKPGVASPIETQPEQIQVKAEQKRPTYRRWYAWGSFAAVVLCLAVWAGLRVLAPVAPIDRFWAPVLSGSGPVLLCVSTGTEGPASGAAAPLANTIAQPLPPAVSAQQNVNMAVGALDLNAINKLSVYLRLKGKDSAVRASQAITLADLRSGPTVLYGSYHNEWARLLENNLRFRFNEDWNQNLRWIEDTTNVASRDWSMSTSLPYEHFDNDYALVTRALDSTTGQWWIAIGGLTGQGTLDVNQFLLDPASMSKLTADLPSGWDKKNLQIVFAIKVVGGSPGVPCVIATYTW